jgi:hypothetical protein
MDNNNRFSALVHRRLEYVTMQVANSERLVLPKPIPSQGRSGRSPSLESRGFRNDRRGLVSRGNSTPRGVCVMALREERKPADNKRVCFPPPKVWDPESAWKFPCVVRECSEKHSPTKCKLFKELPPKLRLAKVHKKSYIYIYLLTARRPRGFPFFILCMINGKKSQL